MNQPTLQEAAAIYHQALSHALETAREHGNTDKDTRQEAIAALRKGLIDQLSVDYVSRQDYDALKSVWHDPAAHHANLLRNPVLTREQLLHLAGAGDYDALKQRATASEAACAEIREILHVFLRQAESALSSDSRSGNMDDIQLLQRAVSSEAGTGWLSPEAAALLRATVEQREAEAAKLKQERDATRDEMTQWLAGPILVRCIGHRSIAALNTNEATGSECGACIAQDKDGRISNLINALKKARQRLFEASRCFYEDEKAKTEGYMEDTVSEIDTVIKETATAAESAAKGDA